MTESQVENSSPVLTGLSHNDTIVALSTGQGPSGVGVVRISGPQSIKIIECFVTSVDEMEDRKAYLRTFKVKGTSLDRLMVMIFRSPRSFTGEDVVELHCHGSPYIVGAIIESTIEAGARQAEPGEFTRRAFLNGKMDLTAAEGLKELIEAQSHQQWLAASQLASGKLAKLIGHLREELIKGMAYLEAQIDFPDEGETANLTLETVKPLVDDVRKRLCSLLGSYENGRVATEGLKVALVGAPNVGKSTLMNVLLGESRAIVTDVAGTTRDFIEERCLINGRLIRLIDTAGLRGTQDQVEAIGVDSSRKILRESDLVLHLYSADGGKSSFVEKDLALVSPEKVVHVLTKADLGDCDHIPSDLKISSKENSGIDQLKRFLQERVDQFVAPLKESMFLTSLRQKRAVSEALGALDRGGVARLPGDVHDLGFVLDAHGLELVAHDLQRHAVLQRQ